MCKHTLVIYVCILLDTHAGLGQRRNNHTQKRCEQENGECSSLQCGELRGCGWACPLWGDPGPWSRGTCCPLHTVASPAPSGTTPWTQSCGTMCAGSRGNFSQSRFSGLGNFPHQGFPVQGVWKASCSSPSPGRTGKLTNDRVKALMNPAARTSVTLGLAQLSQAYWVQQPLCSLPSTTL